MYASFPVNIVRFIKCQKDSGNLTVGNSDIFNNRIVDGSLKCTDCGTIYRIKQGILNLVSLQDSLDTISAQEVKARDKEAETFDEMHRDLRAEMETVSTFAHLGKVSGKNIIEFGCGTGRYTTKLLQEPNQVVALDFSMQSLLVLAKKLKAEANIGLILADITQVCIARESFDLALSFQVLEHIPDKLQRAAFLEKVNKCLRYDGIFLCTAYHYDLRRRLRKMPPEGFHPSNIFFHCFVISELKREARRCFKETHIHPIQIELPFTRRLGLTGSSIVGLSKRLEHVPVLNNFGQLVILKTRKS